MRSEQIRDLYQSALTRQDRKDFPVGETRPGTHDQAYWIREQARFTAEVAAQLSDIKYLLRDLVTAKPDIPSIDAIIGPEKGKTRQMRGPRKKPIRSEVRAEQRKGMTYRTFYIVEYVESDPPKFDSVTQKYPRELEESGIKVHRVLASTHEDATKALRKYLKEKRGLVYVTDEGEEAA